MQVKLSACGVIFVLFSIFEFTNAWISTLLNLGPQDPGCPNWSDYSRCLWITQRTLAIQLPSNCRSNSIFGILQSRIPGGIETPYRVVRQILGANKRWCGQCSFRISCNRGKCRAYNSLSLLNWFNALGQEQEPATENLFGVHDIPCERDTGLACVAEVTKEDCLQWPPPTLDIVLTDPNYYNLAKSLKPIECIVLGGFCYCCCVPYKPDPCSARCVLQHRWERYKEFPDWEAMQYNCPDHRLIPTEPPGQAVGFSFIGEDGEPVPGSSRTSSGSSSASSSGSGGTPAESGPEDTSDGGKFTLRTGGGAQINTGK